MEAAWANEASSSSSSLSISTKFNYDVFLSFSGVDTRNNFTSHLLDALERHGFHTFRDDTKLNRGEYISDALLKAIEESRISVVVLSKNYATSKWCLDELVKIIECKKTLQQIVLPIFYNVEPSDVRAQKGILAEAFVKHEECLKESSDGRVKKWREALTEVASLSGWDLPKVANGDEAQLIRKVIEEVQNQLDLGHLHVACHEIGLESRLKKLKMLLKMESADVHIVAVWGMGGIGKTTIVKKLYNLIQHKFEGSCFLDDIRETSKQPNGLVVLQEKLLSGILSTDTQNIRNFHQGIVVIKRRARCRKVLLILDDVDDVQQLKALAIDRDSFGFGSRIVVTTRDISLLNFLNVDEIYTAEELNTDESLELFRSHCFKEDHPTEDHLDLSDQVVHYAGGLPLALEILGRYFCGKSIPQWEIAIAKLRMIPHDDVQGKLKISFDSLNKDVQELFLDIACFFVGKSRDFTIKVLEGRNSFTKNDIEVLADRCLIKYDPDNSDLMMHDMVRDMGREIVRQESHEDPGKRSRLWNLEDVLEVLRHGTGTEAVKGIQMNAKPFEKMDKLWDHESVLEVQRDSMGTKAVEGRLVDFNAPKDVQVNAKGFNKMYNIWLLHLDYVHLTTNFEHISRRLLWLSWKGFPLECLPWNLSTEKLIALDLRYSSLKKVWNGYKTLGKLKFLYLSHCHYLTRTPDFSGLNSLEELLLNDCKSLVEVDESIRCLDKLLVLDMKNCTKLQKLPSGIWMLKSLDCLDISGCSMLGNLAVSNGPLNKLRCLFFSSWTLPPKGVNSIGFSLTSVQAFGCLKKLNMTNCSLSYLPDEIGNLISLRTLILRQNNLITIPDRICNLTCLELLDLACNNVSHLPSEIGRLTSLQCLYLGSLAGIEYGRSLKNLRLQCKRSLTFPDSIWSLTRLKSLHLGGCNLSHLPSEIGNLVSLNYLNLRVNNICSLPDSIGSLTRLEQLDLDECCLSHLPSEIGNLVSLNYLDLRGNNICSLPDSIGSLTRLEQLNLDRCCLSHLPSEIGNLVSLNYLSLGENNICTLPDSISELHRLQNLYLRNCANLQSLPKLPGRCDVFVEDCASLESLPLELDQLGLHMLCKGSNKLVESDFANRLLKQLHMSKGLAELENVVDILVPTVGDVPIWFPYKGKGSNVSFVVPPLGKQKLLGWVICVFFTGPYVFYERPGEGVLCAVLVDNKVICNKIEKEVVYPRRGYSSSNKDQVIHGYLSSTKDQVWLRYTPQGYSGLHLKDGDEVEISIFLVNALGKNWGVDLIYEVDENITKTNENQEALFQYTSALNQNVSLPEDFSSDKKRRRTF